MIRFLQVMTGFLAGVAAVSPVYGQGLPQPDYDALLKERTAMVTESDFELYAETDEKNGVYYGAKFEPRQGVYIGMAADSAKDFKPLGSYLTYLDSVDQADLYYPSNEMVRSDDAIAMVGWNFNSLANINYDAADKTMAMLNSYNKPMLLRIANEMNVSELGDNPGLYVEAFRALADIAHKYPNLAVVWSPNDIGALNKPFELYYPGDEYVDWVGVSSYMRMYFQGDKNTTYNDSIYFMTGDFAFPTNNIKPIVKFMEDNNIKKPLMLSGCGVATSNTLGDSPESIREWSVPRMRNLFWNLIMKYPQIKMINYFNVHRQWEPERYDITNYSYAANIFRRAEESGAYVRSAGGKSDLVYGKASESGTLVSKNGTVNLYGLVHIPQKPNVTVAYKIDGIEVFSSAEIPYKFGLDVGSLSDGSHLFTMEGEGLKKDYYFTKAGSSISFENIADNPVSPAQTGGISVYTVFGGKKEKLSFDQPPVIIEGRTLVPIRSVFEAMGMYVSWDSGTKTAHALGGETSLKITVNEKTMYKTTGSQGEKALVLDVPAQIINGRTLIPLRAVAESCNADVDWDGTTKTVTVSDWKL